MKNIFLPSYRELNKQEHKLSMVYYGSLMAHSLAIHWYVYGFSIGLVAGGVSLILARRVFFDYPLKVIRGRPFRDIEGDQFFDNLARRIFGARGGYRELILMLVLLTVSYFIIFKYS